ncbi:MAG: AMP-dependent synthetase/ligase, partial [Thiolinea sp.]
GIVSGVYTTDSAEQLAYLVNDSQSKFLFVENEEQLDKYLSIRDEMPSLQKVILYDTHGLHDFQDDAVMTLDELYRLGEEALQQHADLFDDSIAQSQPEDIALLVYTSGTTGKPKGVAINHSNILFVISLTQNILPYRVGDEQLCFLPLSHIYERMSSVFLPIANRSVVNFTESPETVFDNLQEVSPHIFAGVPRIYEKVYSRIQTIISDATPLGQWAYRQAINSGMARVNAEREGITFSVGKRITAKFWEWAVLSNLRRMLGFDRVRYAVTGAAPISPGLIDWFNAIGVSLYEGFGMSETTATTTANYPGHIRMGTVGYIPEGVQVRIADDGEIQLKSGGIFTKYWNKPEATEDAFTTDGWMRTGDSGSIEDNYLTITGRIKDIIITAGGKNVAPAEIENQLKFSPYISDAVVIGDQRKYLTCLIMIDQENVEKYAQDKRVPFADFASLCHTAEVQQLIQQVVEQVNVKFARVEQIKAFRLIDVLLTADDDELTATMKLKRSFVEQKYSALIDEMY